MPCGWINAGCVPTPARLPLDFPAPMMAAISRMGTPRIRICDGRGNVTQYVTFGRHPARNRTLGRLPTAHPALNPLPSMASYPPGDGGSWGANMSVSRSAIKKEPVARATMELQPFVWEGTDKRGVKMKGEQLAKNANLLRAELRRQGINRARSSPSRSRCSAPPAARSSPRTSPSSVGRWPR